MSGSEHPQGGRPDLRVVYVVIGVALILLGLGLLAGIPFFSWYQGLAIRPLLALRRFGWPLAVVLIGILIIVYSRRPGAKLPSREARLTRSPGRKLIAGVFGGLSEYFGIDVSVLRIAYLAFGFLFDSWGALLLAYVAAAIIVPLERDEPADPADGPPAGG